MSGDEDPPVGKIGPGTGPSAPSSVESATAVDAAEAAAPVDGDAEIASALASGAIGGDDARSRLIEEAVRAQLPDDASEEMVAALTAELEALTADDPGLAALLTP